MSFARGPFHPSCTIFICFLQPWLLCIFTCNISFLQDYALSVAVKGGARCSTIVKLPPMPNELQVISSALLNGSIYISGIATKKEKGSSQVQVYSLSENKWSYLPRAANHNAPITDINGRITMIGGREGNCKESKPTNVLSTWCEEASKEGKDSDFPPTQFEKQGDWKQTLLPMPSTRVASGVCHHDNLLLVSGGIEEIRGEVKKYPVVSTVFVYNFSTQCWSSPQILQLPEALRSHHLVLCGQYVYLASGAYIHPIIGDDVTKYFNSKAWRAKWSDVIEAVTPTSTEQQAQLRRGVWTEIAGPPVLRSTVTSCNNSLLSVGGISGGLPQKTIYMLADENTGSPHWIEVGTMSVGRYRHAVVPLGNFGAVLFVAGGFVRENPTEDEVDVKSASSEMVLL